LDKTGRRCSAELLNVAVQRRDLLLADQVSDAFVPSSQPVFGVLWSAVATMELMRQTCDQLLATPQKPVGWSLHAQIVGRYTGGRAVISSV
jgi:hypothetical protein